MGGNIIASSGKPVKRNRENVAMKKNAASIITTRTADRIGTASERYVGIHVQPVDGKWSVRRAGAVRAYGLYADKRKALVVAQEKRKIYAVSYVFVHDNTGDVKQIIR
jgi:uncharacterized protein DUF2188